jgi:hypothetical protein
MLPTVYSTQKLNGLFKWPPYKPEANNRLTPQGKSG